MPAKQRNTRTKEQIKTKKADFMAKFTSLLEQWPRYLLVTCDNIGSQHMQRIRKSLKGGKGQLLMGRNTLMRKAIRDHMEQHPEWESLAANIRGNLGFLFTKLSLQQLRDLVLESTVPAVAKAGAVAPSDVILPKQVTTLEPTKTSFFAALDIATKITKGCVEILNDVKLCESGKKVGSSEAALLQMLEIKPFTYGLKIIHCVEDNCIFNPSFLDFTESTLFEAISQGISRVAALSLAIQHPTLPSFPHVVATGFKNVIAIALETGYMFKQAEPIKHRLENPDANVPVAKVEEKKIEPKVVVPAVAKPKEPSSESGGGDDGLMDFF